MNIDTKYIIRWGIPGWILIMILGPFIYFQFHEDINNLILESNTLALGAFLTVIGVPLGYLLNQIHHSIFWVLWRFRISFKIKKQDVWYEYFRKELQVDKLFFKDEIGQRKKERYQYLLGRKHELGGVTVSLVVVCIVELIVCIEKNALNGWSLVYFIITLMLTVIIAISRWYSSKNIDKYFEQYVKESKNL